MSAPRQFPSAWDATPINGFLGLRLLERGADRLCMALPARPEFVQEGGVIHGGLQATLADSAAVHLLFESLAGGREFTSIEFKLNFLRPAVASDDELLAEARVVKNGRRVALVEVEVSQSGRAVTRGLFTYLYLDAPERGAGG